MGRSCPRVAERIGVLTTAWISRACIDVCRKSGRTTVPRTGDLGTRLRRYSITGQRRVPPQAPDADRELGAGDATSQGAGRFRQDTLTEKLDARVDDMELTHLLRGRVDLHLRVLPLEEDELATVAHKRRRQG